jgi:hypothetical protein
VVVDEACTLLDEVLGFEDAVVVVAAGVAALLAEVLARIPANLAAAGEDAAVVGDGGVGEPPAPEPR